MFLVLVRRELFLVLERRESNASARGPFIVIFATCEGMKQWVPVFLFSKIKD